MISKVGNKNRYDLAYEQIKQEIINNELKPGEKLNVQELSEKMGISRTPVANAMQALERDGYVDIFPQNGTYVKKMSDEELHVINRLREVVELLVLELIIPTVDKKQLEEYKQQFISFQIQKKTSEEIIKEYFEIEFGFHSFLISSSPAIIRSETQNIIDLTLRNRKLSIKHAIETQGAKLSIAKDAALHIKIIDALLKGDLESAKEYLKQDFKETEKGLNHIEG